MGGEVVMVCGGGGVEKYTGYLIVNVNRKLWGKLHNGETRINKFIHRKLI